MASDQRQVTGDQLPATSQQPLPASEIAWEDAPCPLCGPPPSGSRPDRVLFSAEDHLFGLPGSFTLKRCNRCRSLRVDPRPAPRSLGHFYQGYYTPERMQLNAALQLGTGDARFDPMRASALARWRELCAALGRPWPAPSLRPGEEPERLTVVDAGCGLGGFLHHVRQDPRVVPRGVESSPVAVAYARERLGLDVQQGLAEDLPLPDGCADVLTMWHVLEHSPSPRAALAEARRVLRPGGVLAVEVPHGGSLLAALFGPRWFFLQPPTHLTLFSRAALGELVQQAGFEVLRLRHPFVPLELLGSIHYALARPRGLPVRTMGKAALLAIGLGIVLLELPLLVLLGLAGRSGVVRLLARRL